MPKLTTIIFSLFFASCVSAGTISNTAQAIVFDGQVLAVPCTVSLTTGGTSVHLGKNTAKQIMNEEASIKSFSIKLSDCSIGDLNKVYWTGLQEDNTGLLQNYGASPSQATNVAIKFIYKGNNLDTSKSTQVLFRGEGSPAESFSEADLTSTDEPINFTAQMVHDGTGTITSGNVKGTATFNIEYN